MSYFTPMTIGDGIFYSTILLVLAGAIYAISVRGKWKTAGKVFSVFVLVVAVCGGIFYGYGQYQSRLPPPATPEPLATPKPLTAVTEYMEVKLGASRVDVTLKHGAPESERVFVTKTGEQGEALTYPEFEVEIKGGKVANSVSRVCSQSGLLVDVNPFVYISPYENEGSVKIKLGTPSSESISNDGTRKILNYDELNVALFFAKLEVIEICMTENALRYTHEYGIEEQGYPEIAD